jgi:transitional endoplasmic reticulum ATPase
MPLRPASIPSTGTSQTNMRTFQKPLASIPREIYISALQSRPGLVGDAFRALREFAGIALVVVVFAAPLSLFTWGASAFVDDPGKLRLGTTVFLAAVFAACVAYHCLELLMAVPWRDRSYPVLLRHSSVYSLLVRSGHGYSLSATAAAYAALLWLAWWRGWQAASGERSTFSYAALNTAMAAAMFLYGRFQPCVAFRAPTAQDRRWLASDAPAALVTPKVIRPVAADKPAAQGDYITPVNARAARMSFNDIFGMSELKERLLEPARAIVSVRTAGAEAPANGILLHGAPGNGKTVFAEALAGELQVPIVTLTYGDIASKWLGEMPRQISNCFAYARDHAPVVFFIDEIDSFLRSRALGSNNAEDLKIVNTLLTEIVSIRDHRVVLVGATNYFENLDPAAMREGRFDIKLEVTAPDEPARIGLLHASLCKYAGALQVDEETLCSVARRWEGFSVSRLVAICKALPDHMRSAGSEVVGFEQWQAALRLLQGSKARAPAGSKRLAELVLPSPTRKALQLVSARLRDVHRIESLGGTIPSGILLYGAPGTGKTAAARALAVESGWTFLCVAGHDLLYDRDRLNRLYSEAMDLRPSIVFIDEAEDVLADRRFAAAADSVNRLLAIMDGTFGKASDVVFIAATNHPDRVDTALLRAGRFSEKIEFTNPPQEQLVRFIRTWLETKHVSLQPDLDPTRVATLIGPQSIAETQGVLQYALNCAIDRTAATRSPLVSHADVRAAVAVVCGARAVCSAANDGPVLVE